MVFFEVKTTRDGASKVLERRTGKRWLGLRAAVMRPRQENSTTSDQSLEESVSDTDGGRVTVRLPLTERHVIGKTHNFPRTK